MSHQLAQRGMTVVLTARDLEKAESAAEQLAGEGLETRARVLDVADDESVRELASALEKEFGTIDVLVNNAAAYADWTEMASTADLTVAQAVFDTNLFGAWRVCQAFLPLIRRSPRGRIVIVSSGAGSHGEPQFGLTANGGAAATYGISKAARNALTSKLAAELECTGVLVNAVDPGLTATYPGAEAMAPGPCPRERRASYGQQPSPTTVSRAASSATVNPCPGSTVLSGVRVKLDKERA